jgi:hypothetical protein
VESSRRGRATERRANQKKNVESELSFDIAYDMNYSSTVTFFFCNKCFKFIIIVGMKARG